MKVEQIQGLTKQQQYELLRALRPHLSITIAEVARKANVSSALVTYVFQGVNSNTAVLSAIIDNLKPGWEESIPDHLLQVA